MVDVFHDRAIDPKIARFRASEHFQSMPSLRVLVVGVQSNRSPQSLGEIYGRMQSNRHRITFDSKGVDNLGKLDNTNVLLARHDLHAFDWVVMTDDDIELPDQFMDTFLALAEYAELKICGPAQRGYSYWSREIMRRRKGVLVRETNFAEVGPLVAFRREVFDIVFPFPSLKYGWGVNTVWPVLAEKEGWKTGVVDGTALRHTKPIGATYDFREAAREAEEYMNRFGIVTGVHVLHTYRTFYEAG
ncbi:MULTISPECIES: hypothetical protein [unclassified Sphingobium]|uniref:hypothetical protein n=1 Tax=unclassified Sphingobium TaxID=2611147 RepID=UPI0016078B5A|nr:MULTISPECIES: hypothetical protein [unclassified Sphingobium]MCW2400238.1 GT2 family glycosyltransferase [Sphingobium sp. B10D7B]